MSDSQSDRAETERAEAECFDTLDSLIHALQMMRAHHGNLPLKAQFGPATGNGRRRHQTYRVAGIRYALDKAEQRHYIALTLKTASAA